MKTLMRKIGLGHADSGHGLGKSWTGKFTAEQHLRANSALSSLTCSVSMAESDDDAVRTATLLLRGVNRMRWAD